jgi:hypothetical protein
VNKRLRKKRLRQKIADAIATGDMSKIITAMLNFKYRDGLPLVLKNNYVLDAIQKNTGLYDGVLITPAQLKSLVPSDIEVSCEEI